MDDKRLGLNSSMAARNRAAYCVAERKPFSNSSGTLWGAPGGAVMFGRLPSVDRRAAETASYVIYSYGTPIAWVNDRDWWYAPETRYSPTTSKHQTITAGILHKAKAGVVWS